MKLVQWEKLGRRTYWQVHSQISLGLTPFMLWGPPQRMAGLSSAPGWTAHEASLHAGARRSGSGRVYPVPMAEHLMIDLFSENGRS